MDPPYEIKTDYEQAAVMIAKAYKRFSSGTYMIWYPVVSRSRIDELELTLKQSGIRNIQLFELATEQDTERHGMTSSGMIVINPPWTLKKAMDTVLPELVFPIKPKIWLLSKRNSLWMNRNRRRMLVR